MHCGLSSRTPSEVQQKVRALLRSAPETPTPLRIREGQNQVSLIWEEKSADPDSQHSGSSFEVQGESLLSSILQVQEGSSSVQQLVQEQSGSTSAGPGRSGSCSEDFGCFPLAGQVEVWWSQQPAKHQDSPRCPAHMTNPFELSGELQVVMFGKTDDQLSAKDDTIGRIMKKQVTRQFNYFSFTECPVKSPKLWFQRIPPPD
ncbi:uncharacterized protein PAE49_015490 [Odontesthes bonariensis]